MPDSVIEALRELAPVSRGQVRVNGDGEAGGERMLCWVESGNGAPAVVLIAGRNDTALSWGPVPDLDNASINKARCWASARTVAGARMR